MMDIAAFRIAGFSGGARCVTYVSIIVVVPRRVVGKTALPLSFRWSKNRRPAFLRYIDLEIVLTVLKYLLKRFLRFLCTTNTEILVTPRRF
jgi:hypothetical protein